MPERGWETQVGYLLVQASKRHRGEVARRLARLGLHPGQDLLLIELARQDGATQSELVERLEVDPSTITKVLARMEAGGLVVRRRDPDDARVVRVSLTDRGRALVEPVLDAWSVTEARMTSGLTGDELEFLRRLLARLRRNLD